ncbi:cysteinyl-tRNA synthetase [Ligilactobacillus acidipiscis DSM 15836]|uniref:Cysteine--tRNA ligase n=1 Tax=Ligilactobacillus acidipiscis DSM 15836 TaxID=1423716 RepID=A0ABR5PIW7_9LACO|nr:cysteine--tRNA ligase [Ligilactobacillus acidipiscis]KRM26106.1 cysteinyl-tRNA synthetase [Ligilactobacillus acidipiscis DSM 15836]GAW64323.1 cysteinyl-tRNA synthetase [Ligilactobacillus acidipiscis]GEN20688.1 cysteine--tRNA ligase [Ligilactobacillus acidipiscis]
MIQLYNTLTKKKEEFVPMQPGKVRMYVCGPTVYNYIHIGNARSAIAFDTVRRYLEYRGYQVKYVSNFTDVDDKIIKASQKMGLTVPEVTEKFIKAFYADTDALNVKRANLNPRVMDNMDGIIEFVKVLVDKGYAYESGGDVYYRARKFKRYGLLSGQSVNDLEQGASARLSVEDQAKKEDPLDFAVWKSAKTGEIAWDSPFGKGRPGWHIECSVMATKYLGDTIDIHGGGQDLEFPHHENEIAQSEAKTGKKFANYWMHNGFVTIGEEDEKMSKSLGNFVTVRDLLKEVDPQIVRFFMATTQYRRPIRYTSANLDEAKTNLERIQTAATNIGYRLQDAKQGAVDPTVQKEFQDHEAEFEAAMDDDFNAQNGIAVVYELVKQLNIYAAKEEVTATTLQYLLDGFEKIVGVFGIKLKHADILDDEVETKIEQRNAARKNKDFALSDQIRDELKEQGIILEDTPQGTRWKRE